MGSSVQKTGAESIAARLRYRMAELGMNAVELARKAEIRPSFIYDIMHGKSSNPSAVKLARVARELGTDMSYFLGSDRRSVALPSGIDVARGDYGSGLRECLSTIVIENGVGGIKLSHSKPENDALKFSGIWAAEKFGVLPESLRVITVKGDSMEPTFVHNDVIIFDTIKNFPSPPGIYVIFDGYGLVVKRLELISMAATSTIRVISDNPQYAPQEKSISDIQILGRVIWFSREM